MVLGIDASTRGSGGAKRHLIELFNNINPNDNEFEQIKIWGGYDLLKSIPDYPWLEKLSHPLLNKNVFFRTIWMLVIRDRSFFKSNIDILFCPFGTYSGSFTPFVSMSRNMLIFDRIERKRFPTFSLINIKLIILNYFQVRSFKKASGIIFISEHAQSFISNKVNIKKVSQQIIHHGVSHQFDSYPKKNKLNYLNSTFKLLYVSTIWPYKHHLNVIKAIQKIRNRGYRIEIDFVGSPEDIRCSKLLENEILKFDIRDFVFWHKNIDLDGVVSFYKNADAFIFASTCENMPNILIEAMSSGLPILSSNYPPMPEFLENAGIYFDPTSVLSIEESLLNLIENPENTYELSLKSYALSKKYSWKKCAIETLNYLKKIKTNEKYI